MDVSYFVLRTTRLAYGNIYCSITCWYMLQQLCPQLWLLHTFTFWYLYFGKVQIVTFVHVLVSGVTPSERLTERQVQNDAKHTNLKYWMEVDLLSCKFSWALDFRPTILREPRNRSCSNLYEMIRHRAWFAVTSFCEHKSALGTVCFSRSRARCLKILLAVFLLHTCPASHP